MKHYITTLLYCVGLLLLGSSPIFAQMDGPPPGDRPGRERIEQLRQMKMVEALDLNEEQALRLSVRDKDFKKKEQEMLVKHRDLLKELQKMVKDDASDEQIAQALDRMKTLHMSITEAKHEHLLSLKDFLSMQQIAKMHLFEKRFNEELRRLLSKQGSRRPPRH